ncbi:uncharacterized protein [Dermacentor albipictus]|uniref:uncharacterized protein isoform X4 n=1 Tax=Dermacentor albipictus TaxID=60249 RepID=UPI0038FD2FBD
MPASAHRLYQACFPMQIILCPHTRRIARRSEPFFFPTSGVAPSMEPSLTTRTPDFHNSAWHLMGSDGVGYIRVAHVMMTWGALLYFHFIPIRGTTKAMLPNIEMEVLRRLHKEFGEARKTAAYEGNIPIQPTPRATVSRKHRQTMQLRSSSD